jgi:protoporphyrinogen oxidase
MNNLVVVGGGITGLAAAYLAAKAGVKVTVLESSDAVGGLLATFEVEGTRLECFYHHAFTHDEELRWLLRELGIEDRLEFWPGTMGVFRGGHIYDFNTARDLLRFKPLSVGDKMRFVLTSLYLARLAKWQDQEGVPALDWFHRHAGRHVAEAIWEPLLRVKFGPYADKTPLAWMVGRMRQRVNSRRGGKENSVTSEAACTSCWNPCCGLLIGWESGCEPPYACAEWK